MLFSIPRLPWLVAGLLACSPVLAQQPTTPTVPPAPAPTAAPVGPALELSRTYRIETATGTVFTGQLVGLSLTVAEFESKELGHISLARDQVRRADDQNTATPGQKASYYDTGNGNSLFAAPTGRGLRKGEGSLQTIDLFLVGASYGITKNFSMGAYVSLIPGVPVGDQALLLTPKFNVAITPKLYLGIGGTFINVPFTSSNSGLAGLGYGALTYGSANDNLTLGLGYGFGSGTIRSTPIFQLGGQKRLSNRVSLVSENYLVANKRAGFGGLYGIKFNWRRTNLGLGAAYACSYAYTETNTYPGYTDAAGNVYPGYTNISQSPSVFVTSYVLPVYVDFTFRFGKGANPK